MRTAVTARSVLLAAGGTGGHLFPAQALAEELARRAIPVDLVTDMRGDRYGASFPARAVYRVPSATLAGARPSRWRARHWMLTRGLGAAFKLLGAGQAEVRSSASAAIRPSRPSIAARLRRIPTALHEQNAVLGRANRMLAKRRDAHRHLVRAHQVPGRPELEPKVAPHRQPGARSAVIDGRAAPYRAPERGGPIRAAGVRRQPGRALLLRERAAGARAAAGGASAPACFVVQQAAQEDLSKVEAAYRACADRGAIVAAFFANLPEELAKAHLVIARSGASTVAELTVIGRPAILVPLPHSLDNDQLQNATRLAESGAAWCIEQKDLSPERLAQRHRAAAELDRISSAGRRPPPRRLGTAGRGRASGRSGRGAVRSRQG